MKPSQIQSMRSYPFCCGSLASALGSGSTGDPKTPC